MHVATNMEHISIVNADGRFLMQGEPKGLQRFKRWLLNHCNDFFKLNFNFYGN